MAKYEEVYNWKVLDEIKAGNEVFVINKALYGRCDAILKANTMSAGELMLIIGSDNTDKKYEFYKIVRKETKK